MLVSHSALEITPQHNLNGRKSRLDRLVAILVFGWILTVKPVRSLFYKHTSLPSGRKLFNKIILITGSLSLELFQFSLVLCVLTPNVEVNIFILRKQICLKFNKLAAGTGHFMENEQHRNKRKIRLIKLRRFTAVCCLLC